MADGGGDLGEDPDAGSDAFEPDTGTDMSVPPPGTIYVAADGDDGNDGSMERPYRTLSVALGDDHLREGYDVVVLGTGRLDPVNLDCSPTSTACADGPCIGGSAEAPVRVRAQTARAITISPPEAGGSLRVERCEGMMFSDFVVEGAVGSSDPAASRFGAVEVRGSDHIGFYGMLVHGPSPYGFYVLSSDHVHIEGAEVLGITNDGVHVRYSASPRVVASYLSLPRAETTGEESGIYLLSCTDSRIENVIVEGFGIGFNIVSSRNDTFVAGSQTHRIYGSVSLRPRIDGYRVFTSCSSNNTCNQSSIVSDVLIEHSAALAVPGYAFTLRSVEGAVLRRVTSYAAAGRDYHAVPAQNLDTFVTPLPAPTVLFDRALDFGGGADGYFFVDMPDATILDSESYYNDRELYTMATVPVLDNYVDVRPGGVGHQMESCRLWVPPTAHAGQEVGATIGADIRQVFDNGVPTARPYWVAQEGGAGFFACGLEVPGVNDTGEQCRNVHERLNINDCPQ